MRRICLVTPFSWSQPHEANDHVARRRGGAAAARTRGDGPRALRPRRPSCRPAAARCRGELSATSSRSGRRPVSRRSSLGVPVGRAGQPRARAAKRRLRRRARHRPGLPSLSYLALLEAETLTAATFLSVDRLGYPTRRAAARPAARARRRAPRAPRTPSRGRGRALPGRLPRALRPASTPPATRPAEANVIAVEVRADALPSRGP